MSHQLSFRELMALLRLSARGLDLSDMSPREAGAFFILTHERFKARLPYVHFLPTLAEMVGGQSVHFAVSLGDEVYTFQMRPLDAPDALTEPLSVVVQRIAPSAGASPRVRTYSPLKMVALWNGARHARHAVTTSELGRSILAFARSLDAHLPTGDALALCGFLASLLIVLADGRGVRADMAVQDACFGSQLIGSFSLAIRALDKRPVPSSRIVASSVDAEVGMQLGSFDGISLNMTKPPGGRWRDA